ncbi:unnamed protein product [Orchesella dallaii]|uniref:Lipase domain-containing protein n=1 Tax=Orchesella dallaii TaxID=48710 RepID=A0ABP1QHF5_9HEXA
MTSCNGLDPALNGYWPENKDKNLEKADASFVDVIHTNAGLLGVKDKVKKRKEYFAFFSIVSNIDH